MQPQVFSIKQSDVPGYGRARAYWESRELDVANWKSSVALKPGQRPVAGQAYDWTSADLADPPFVCSKEAQEWSFGHQLYVVDGESDSLSPLRLSVLSYRSLLARSGGL